MDINFDKGQLERLVMDEFPYPIAVNYRRLQELTDWKDKQEQVIHILDFLLRTLCLALISQYLIIDRDVSDSHLNQLLEEKLPKPSLGCLVEIFFTTLCVYNKHPKKRLFMTELHGFFKSKASQKLKKGIREPFDRFVQLRNDKIHELRPRESSAEEMLFNGLHSNLLLIFNELSFICNYNLIHFIRQEGTTHYYQRYRGEQIVEINEPINSSESLGEGWFYLAKGESNNLKLLKLYPFLIAWEEDANSQLPGMQSDAALLDTFSDSSIRYWATVLWKSFFIKAGSVLTDFTDSYERSLRMKQQTEAGRVPGEGVLQISWESLKQAVIEITAQQVGAARARYNKALYLQRSYILHKFEEFLASDKRCFVLTGKSGVGKSNFVYSLKDEFSKRGDDTCFLIYNAARLNPAENITQMISQDFSHYMQFTGPANQGLFEELENSGEMQGKLLVVVFDAINENVGGKTLLRNIDSMITENDHAWLKVAITSRPESWKALKRGVPLAEALYYRERDQDELGIELPEFTIQLDPFHREELPLVYELYQNQYHLGTKYESLTPSIRNALRDPLILRLVAEIFRNQRIPETLQVMDIYGQYIQALIDSERLSENDIRFVEQEIMPLMITEKTYSNRLLSTQINEAQTRDGRSLWELISNDDLLTNGRPVNETFQRLVDAEILLRLGSPVDYEVGFKYERFFDYFASRRLQAILDAADEEINTYQKLLMDLSKYPFMWGATLRVLTNKMTSDRELLLALAYLNDQTSQKMIIEVFSEYAKQGDKPNAEVPGLLAKLMSSEIPVQLEYQKPDEVNNLSAKVVAVEVSARIHAESILVRACNDKSAQVRSLSVQRIADLWKIDIEAGKKTLNLIANKSAHRILGVPIPNGRILESAIGAAALIFAENYTNEPAIRPLREVSLRKLFNTLLPLNVENPLGRVLNLLAYFLLSNTVIELVNKIPSKAQKYQPANFIEISEFFHLPREKRDLMLEMLPAFYPENGPLNQYREVLKKAAAVADGDMNWVINEILAKRGITEPIEAADIFHELFEMELVKEKPSYLAALLFVGYGEFLLRMDPNSEECKNLFQKYEAMVKPFYEFTRGRVNYKNLYYADVLGYFIATSYRLYRKANYEMVNEILSGICEREDWELLGSVVYRFRELGVKYPYPVLYSLEALLMDKRAQVVSALVNIISQISVRYPDEVLDFLESHKYSQQLKDSLATSKQSEEIIEQLGGFLTDFLLDATRSPSLLDAMVLLLGQMPHVRNIKQWLSILAAYIANLSYQDALFKAKMWPVDVGYKTIKNPFE